MTDLQKEEYNYFPPITIGGPTGNYFVDCPVQSGRWAEYAIVSLHSDTSCDFVVSGDSAPQDLDFTGATTLSADAYVSGVTCGTATTRESVSFQGDVFYRITHSQKRVFVRVNVASGHAGYITIRFRVKLISIIPSPSPTVHPDAMQNMNIAREQSIKSRMNKMGIPSQDIETHNRGEKDA